MKRSLRYNNRGTAEVTFFVEALGVSIAAGIIAGVGLYYRLPERIEAYWRGEPYKKVE